LRNSNSVDYRTSYAIFTKNIAYALEEVKRSSARQTYINHSTLGSKVHLPFGGVKSSGSNKEGGPVGTVAYTELKTVYIDYSNCHDAQSVDGIRKPRFNTP
jgi:acyl-CoA reductase-like NAD-dependent aldehyde dehydrogenase